MFDTVRNNLLEEATQSPNLLSDLAGLEGIVSETYNARSFFELLQNSDDAGATRFLIRRTKNTLIVANNGRDFTPDDLESLCRSAASKKNRAESIGYRGIGFKSIVSFADEVAILSGPMRVFFSRGETQRAVKHSGRVPLIRVPHWLDDTNTFICSDVAGDLLGDSFSTIFIFKSINEPAIDIELQSFDESALLFLRSVEHIDFSCDNSRAIRVTRESIAENTQRVELHGAQESSQWLLETSGDIQLAMSYGNHIVKKLDNDQAVAHAFLPTSERTGIGAKIQAPFDTDPSRTKVVLNDKTTRIASNAADLIVNLIRNELDQTSDSARSTLPAILPLDNIQVVQLRKPSFDRVLLQALVDSGKRIFRDYTLCPRWLSNYRDYEHLAKHCGLSIIPSKLAKIESLRAYLRSCGAREARLEDLVEGLGKYEISEASAAEILHHLYILQSTGQLKTKISQEWVLWPVGSGVRNLKDAVQSGEPIRTSFVSELEAKDMSVEKTIRMLPPETGTEAVSILFPQRKKISTDTDGQKANIKSPELVRKLSIESLDGAYDWRKAEKAGLYLLNELGWELDDVSEQNLGYDLQGRRDDGSTVHVEVKLVNTMGTDFSITSNEESQARRMGASYVILLISRSGTSIKYCLIDDPVSCVRMVRRCRQWDYKCSDYPIVESEIRLV